MSMQTKYLLNESQMPKFWYNIQADLPKPLPAVLHPGTLQPIGPADLAPLFPMDLILQEVSTEREIEIPEPVRDIYKLWRPAPLYRAHRLEKALGTPAKIFYKYEGVSPAGSHKPNTAVPQAFYNAAAGVKRLTTETGAGQWGTSLAFAGNVFGLEVLIFQVRVSYDQKPYRRAVMETYGARCLPSPSTETVYGRSVLAQRPDHPGSLGIAISEAVELAVQRDDTKYALGSVLNHVLMHQTIIGLEAMEQMQMADVWPDVVVGCTGGGSNFAGIAFPFIGHGLRGGAKPRIVAVEPAACPSLTRGKYAYDFGDTGHMTPLTKMHTLGSAPSRHRASTPAACVTTAWRRWCRTSRNWACWKPPPTHRASALKPACCLPVRRASCPRPKPTTRSRAPSRRPCAASVKARARPSCSTSAATATST
jgi:tryptophan synthase beta chain